MPIWNIFKRKEKCNAIRLVASDSFGLISNQIIYVEGSYDTFFNQYIENNYDKITSIFKERSEELDFIYLPIVQDDILSSTEEFTSLINYFLPYSNTNRTPINHKIEIKESTAIHSRKLFTSFNYSGKIQPGLLKLTTETDEAGNFIFEYLPLVKSDYLEKQMVDYASCITITPTIKIKTDLVTPDEIDQKRGKGRKLEDEIFSKRLHSNTARKSLFEEDIEVKEDLHKLYHRERNTIEKIKKNIEELKNLGYYEILIREMLSKLIDETTNNQEAIQISRLCMDSEFKIYLPDYKNVEIKMTTLPKALYILFLRHPEGIILKQLSDFEPELMKIYQIISNRENLSDMNDSVKRMCSPIDQSVNEKISRIREAFVSQISDNYAKHYYITGDRGKEKLIKIDLSLVSLPDSVSKIKIHNY